MSVVLSFCGCMKIKLLPPATKLGQGYVFTRVCDSVQRGGSPSGGGFSVRGDLCPRGVFVQGGLSGASLSGGSLMKTPPYGNERAVRILLECSLVLTRCHTMQHVIKLQYPINWHFLMYKAKRQFMYIFNDRLLLLILNKKILR